MNHLPDYLNDFLRSDWSEEVGWVLLNSLWQIAFIASLYACVAYMHRNGSANVRYLIGCILMQVMLLLPIVTYCALPRSSATDADSMETVAGSPLPREERSTPELYPRPSQNVIETTSPPMTPAEAPELPRLVENEESVSIADSVAVGIRAWLPVATLAWLLGVIVLSMRPLAGWFYVRRLRRTGHTPLPEPSQSVCNRLKETLGVRQIVRFAQSTLVEVPTVIGCLRPVVLLPVSTVTGLTTRELELIVAHELAHIRRHDYIVNLGQTVIESLLFYHPAMWWLSIQVRRERENCCDDAAIAVSGDRTTYVRALAQLERNRMPAPALAANGGSLLLRVRRILGQPSKQFGDGKPTTLLAGILAVSLVAAMFAVGSAQEQDESIRDSNEDPSAMRPTDDDFAGEGASSLEAESNVCWGEAVGGLQAGLAVVGQQSSYQIGQNVPLQFLVRNISDTPIEFEQPRVPVFINWSNYRNKPGTQLFGPQGQVLPAPGVGGRALPGQVSRTIQPGQAAHVASVRLPLREEGWNGTSVNLLAYCVEAGVHQASLSRSINGNTLTTGKLRLSVNPSDPATPTLGSPWGKRKNGIRCRLHKSNEITQQGEPLILAVDLQNRGSESLEQNWHSLEFRLEVDGKWTDRLAPLDVSGPVSPLAPGQEWINVPLVLENNRYSMASAGTSSAEPDFTQLLSPGRHKIRIDVDGIISQAIDVKVAAVQAAETRAHSYVDNNDESIQDAPGESDVKFVDAKQQLIGRWIGGEGIMPIHHTFSANGTYKRRIDGEPTEEGTWRLDGTRLVRDVEGKEQTVSIKWTNPDAFRVEQPNGDSSGYNRVDEETEKVILWGEPVDGISLRLAPLRQRWEQSDSSPAFELSLSNWGDAVDLADSLDGAILEIDEQEFLVKHKSWEYRANRRVTSQMALEPFVKFRFSLKHGLVDLLDNGKGGLTLRGTYSLTPYDSKASRVKSGEFQLLPGKHTLRVALDPQKNLTGRMVYPYSNPVEIEILAGNSKRIGGNHHQSGTIRGKLVDSTGPYSILLDHELWESKLGLLPNLVVPAGGTFEFTNVPLGNCKVIAQPITAPQEGQTESRHSRDIEVKDKQTIELELASSGWAVVSELVSDKDSSALDSSENAGSASPTLHWDQLEPKNEHARVMRDWHNIPYDKTRAIGITRSAELPDVWEEVPAGSKSFEVRKSVKVVSAGLDAMIYYRPDQERFWVQRDPPASSFRTWFGPFRGDPFVVLGIQVDKEITSIEDSGDEYREMDTIPQPGQYLMGNIIGVRSEDSRVKVQLGRIIRKDGAVTLLALQPPLSEINVTGKTLRELVPLIRDRYQQGYDLSQEPEVRLWIKSTKNAVEKDNLIWGPVSYGLQLGLEIPNAQTRMNWKPGSQIAYKLWIKNASDQPKPITDHIPLRGWYPELRDKDGRLVAWPPQAIEGPVSIRERTVEAGAILEVGQISFELPGNTKSGQFTLKQKYRVISGSQDLLPLEVSSKIEITSRVETSTEETAGKSVRESKGELIHAAAARAEQARRELVQQKRLYEKGIASLREVQEAEMYWQLAKAQSLIEQSEAKAKQHEVSLQKLEKTLTTNHPRVVQETVLAARARYEASQSLIFGCEAREKFSRLELERQMVLFAQGIVSTQELEEAKTNWHIAKAELSAARKNSEARKKEILLEKSKDPEDQSSKLPTIPGLTSRLEKISPKGPIRIGDVLQYNLILKNETDEPIDFDWITGTIWQAVVDERSRQIKLLGMFAGGGRVEQQHIVIPPQGQKVLQQIRYRVSSDGSTEKSLPIPLRVSKGEYLIAAAGVWGSTLPVCITINPQARLQFRMQMPTNARPNDQADRVSWTDDDGRQQTLFLYKEVYLDEDDVQSATLIPDGESRQIRLTFTERGSQQMRSVTTPAIADARRLVILLDGKVIAAPKVRAVISDSASISGLTAKEAQSLQQSILATLAQSSVRNNESREDDANSSTDRSTEPRKTARLIISKDRGGHVSPGGVSYVFENELISIDRLQLRLKKEMKASPNLKLIIQADPELPYRTVTVALQLAQAAGVETAVAATDNDSSSTNDSDEEKLPPGSPLSRKAIVTGPGGGPGLPGVDVEAYIHGQQEPVLRTQTDDQGYFLLPNSPPGEESSGNDIVLRGYYLKIAKPGYIPWKPVIFVGLDMNGNYSRHNFLMRRATVVAGKLLGSDGKPLPGAEVHLSTVVDTPGQRPHTGSSPQITKSDGSFRFDQVFPGRHLVRFHRVVFEGRIIEPSKRMAAAVVETSDAKGGELNVEGVLLDLSQSTSSVEVTVLGKDGNPAADREIELSWRPLLGRWGGGRFHRSLHGESYPKAITNADGQATFTGVPPGTWDVRVSWIEDNRIKFDSAQLKFQPQSKQKVTLSIPKPTPMLRSGLILEGTAPATETSDSISNLSIKSPSPSDAQSIVAHGDGGITSFSLELPNGERTVAWFDYRESDAVQDGTWKAIGNKTFGRLYLGDMKPDKAELVSIGSGLEQHILRKLNDFLDAKVSADLQASFQAPRRSLEFYKRLADRTGKKIEDLRTLSAIYSKLRHYERVFVGSHGVDVQILGDVDRQWQPDEIPTYAISAVNYGENEKLILGRTQQAFELEVDGKWYRQHRVQYRSSPLPPGRLYDKFPLTLNGTWQHKETPLHLSPGKHMIRVRCRVHPFPSNSKSYFATSESVPVWIAATDREE